MLFTASTLFVAQKVAEEAAKPEIDPILKGLIVLGALLFFGVLAIAPFALGGKKKF